MTDLSVVIADDHPVFRSGLQALLGVEPGVKLVGEAATGTQAVQLARDLKPDVVLMDLHMPDLDGLWTSLLVDRSAGDEVRDPRTGQTRAARLSIARISAALTHARRRGGRDDRGGAALLPSVWLASL